METAFVADAFGVEATVVELMDRILPIEDEESAALVASAFAKRGVKLLTGIAAQGFERKGEGLELRLKAKDGTESPLVADRVLVSVGRSPNTKGLGLEEVGVRLEKGFVAVGDYQESSVSGIYAIGDVVATPLLAHVASKEGEIAAERIAQVIKGSPPPSERRVDPLLVPSAVYCEPELGSFGLAEEKAKAEGRTVGVARFPYIGVGKAVATGVPEGQAKIIYDPRTRAILGATIVGAGATELVHELLLAARSELLLDDVADMIHAHPTLIRTPDGRGTGRFGEGNTYLGVFGKCVILLKSVLGAKDPSDGIFFSSRSWIFVSARLGPRSRSVNRGRERCR